ncbi:MAG: ribosomal protein S18-alanine N-acetyltransferase [Paenibacillaceae bacterium]
MEMAYNSQSAGPAPHSVTFRAMHLDDIEQICLIEKACFPTPWTEDAFLNELEHNTFARYVVMTWNDIIIGYAGMWTILDEAHITNIAVLERYRGRKLGERLLRELVVLAMSCGMLRMTLEVRTSNYTAQRLYEKFGFRAEGLRRAYYSDNGEDAIIMWAELPSSELFEE